MLETERDIGSLTGKRVRGPGDSAAPLVVGIGGTIRPSSSTELAVGAALSAARAAGARTLLFGAADLQLPLFSPAETRRTPEARALIDAIKRADGLVIGTPAYHGGVSGLVKNALDYIEDLREDSRPYLHGRAVGCVVTARGPQAASALSGLRAVVHALRGWPTPLGVTVNTETTSLAPDGNSTDPRVTAQLATMGGQVVDFLRVRAAAY